MRESIRLGSRHVLRARSPDVDAVHLMDGTVSNSVKDFLQGHDILLEYRAVEKILILRNPRNPF